MLRATLFGMLFFSLVFCQGILAQGINEQDTFCAAEEIVGITWGDFCGSPEPSEICGIEFSSIYSDNENNFIILLEGDRRSAPGPSLFGIYAQKFNNEGEPISEIFQIQDNNEKEVYAQAPSLVFNNDGSFVVAWNIDLLGRNVFDIYVQRYNRDCEKIGEKFIVNTERLGNQYMCSIANNSRGDFIFVWGSDSQEDDCDLCGSIYAQRFDREGFAIGSEFHVNTYEIGFQFSPDVAMDENGVAFIIWHDGYAGKQDGLDGDGSGIFGQLIDRENNKIGSQVRINSTTTKNQIGARIKWNEGLGFLVSWLSHERGQIIDGKNEYILKAQRYNDNGEAIGSEITLIDSLRRFSNLDFLVFSFSRNNSGLSMLAHPIIFPENNTYQINIQTYNNELDRIGENILISSPRGTQFIYPSLTMNNDNAFVVYREVLGSCRKPPCSVSNLINVSKVSCDKLFVRGGVNADGQVNLSDAVFVIYYLFRDGGKPNCLDAADINDDGALDLADPIYLLNYLFVDGPAPLPPFPASGFDPTPDNLMCEN